MLPLRLVLDTNVVISGALKPASLQRTALLIALTKPARLYATEEILDEYAEVLARAELRIPRWMQLQTMQLIRNVSHMVTPGRTLAVCRDAEDDRFVECADAARADYLITGNLRHFPKYWKMTKVISARELVELAAPHLLP